MASLCNAADRPKRGLFGLRGLVQRCLSITASVVWALSVATAAHADDWAVIGRQGIVRLVLVPTEKAADKAAYDQQIDRLCQPGDSCFLNFYTNTQGVAIAVPLPDDISSQSTATFRRSFKQGGQMFMWSCRLKVSSDACF